MDTNRAKHLQPRQLEPRVPASFIHNPEKALNESRSTSTMAKAQTVRRRSANLPTASAKDKRNSYEEIRKA